MPIPKAVAERIATFTRNLDSYTNPDYKEAQVRQEFIDPFFAALGWDVSNEQGYAEAYKDVVHEDSLRIAGAGTTAPDYSFRIGGTRKFFVEAKKPSLHLKDDPEPALQLRRYSWSDKLSLGIVTDFQEFAIYDTRIRPHEGDKASIARIFYCTYIQYSEKWDEIAGIFSREAVLKGSFDRYAATNKGKRGTSEFDDAFLADMELWRELLARSVALRNSALTQRELNFAVQRILDRIIFLRIAEDRGIEPYGQLKALIASPRIYSQLGEIFERADLRYNSGIFHFSNEIGRNESPDRLTLDLKIDDAPLREIIGSLYWPKSPYAFSVVPADILGQVYEQFLGKVIHLTPEHHARVEEKPEVRKAGGVYYTPTYIVHYIIVKTIGPLVTGKTPKQIEKLRVLDPACGSGSFLLGAYDFLLDWHLRYYLDHEPTTWAKRKNPPIYESTARSDEVGRGVRNWFLTTAERKRILVSNLYGTDIDSQAVEVTKLSLLLKVLEGESRELRGQQIDFHRVLPDLGNNIKCGNSLIGSDFYQQTSLPLIDEEERLKINAFDWAEEFKPIMDGGGFDSVIGNPPYIFTRDLISSEERDYFRQHYSAAEDKHNTFVLFMIRLLHLTKKAGRSGLIIPNSWLTVESCIELRRLYAPHLDDIVDLNFQVWPRVAMEPSIFVVEKFNNNEAFSVARIQTQEELTDKPRSSFRRGSLDQKNFRIAFGTDPTSERLLSTLAGFPNLGAIFDVRTGLQAYEKGKGTPTQTKADVANHIYDRTRREDASCHPYLEGRDVGRYRLSWSKMWMSWGPWLSQPRELNIFQRPRLLIREITAKPPRRIYATYTDGDFLSNKSVITILHKDDDRNALKALLGLLNSKITSFFYQGRAVKGARKLFPKIVINNLREFPVPKSMPGDSLVVNVERMLKLHGDFLHAKSPDEQSYLLREISAIDRVIDQLAYKLFDLSETEIAVVESSGTQ